MSRNELHYLTNPEGEWRCAECQQMCTDDARCDCCGNVFTKSHRELRAITDHLADFHEDNAPLMLLIVNAWPGGPTAVVEAIRDGWLHEWGP